MSSFTYRHSIITVARPSALWRLYSDVSSWPRWDHAAELVTIDGPFDAGSAGTMKFRGQDPISYTLVAVQPERSFVDQTPVPGGAITFRHEIDELPGGRVRLTHGVEIDGPETLAQQLGPMITAGIPDTMLRLAQLAQDTP